jgi:hypothetical protein
MPNQYNFRSDIGNNTETRFLASRIVKFPEERVLLEQLPASFAYNPEDNIEIHFYTFPANSLILSMTVTMEDTDVLKSHVVSYAAGTYKNYIRIDFTALFEKKQEILIPGEYKMVLNYFSDEIGSYFNRKLFLQTVSDSGTEVQLAFIDNINDVNIAENENILYEFVEPSFNKPTAIGVAEKIFKSGVELDDPTEGIIYENITGSIELNDVGQTYDNTIARVNRLGEVPSAQLEDAVNKFLPILYDGIREELIIRGDRRIQQEEFESLAKEVLEREFPNFKAQLDRRIVAS